MITTSELFKALAGFVEISEKCGSAVSIHISLDIPAAQQPIATTFHTETQASVPAVIEVKQEVKQEPEQKPAEAHDSIPDRPSVKPEPIVVPEPKAEPVAALVAVPVAVTEKPTARKFNSICEEFDFIVANDDGTPDAKKARHDAVLCMTLEDLLDIKNSYSIPCNIDVPLETLRKSIYDAFDC